jgi:cyclophilin family peptidyl-prolyl cis-trans isomerase/predicted DsbA family dithiol-disulfide isomerase
MLYYCDFQSTQCELFNRVLDDLVKNHPSELRVVFRPFPVPSSVVAALDKSELAARAALAASDQDRFWEMRDILHSRFSDWANLPAGSFERWTMQQAAGLGLDKVKFQSDMQSAATEARVRSMYDSAVGIGISSIPTVFINGRLQPRAALSYDGLEATISLIALGSRQFKTCPPFDIDPSRQYRAILHTEKGDIVIALYPDKAPLAVNSFVFLARHRWYDGVTFHRVIPGFLAQAGDPSGTGRGGPGYLFNSEVHADMLFDRPGVVGMANAGPDTNGSQFFITYGPEAQLDGSFTVFGQVIAGMNVVESLTPRDPQSSNTPPLGDKILTVMIEEQ